MGKARDYIPALRYGHKIMPEDIAGMLGLPHVGTIFYVDPSAGNDSTNSGKSQDDAFATVATAYAACTSGKHDVVVIAPTGGTGRTSETAAITWAKRFTHLVGSAAPTVQNTRAGMSFGASIATGLTVSENGCLFANLTIATFEDNNGLVSITGDYNRFHNVHFAGIGIAAAGDDAAARCVVLTGGQENTFTNCTFGLDTIMRGGAANATIEFASASSRNVFDNCRFIMATDGTEPVHVLFTGTSAIDRWVEFSNCLFYNFTANDAAEPAAVMDLSAQTATGHVLLTGICSLVDIDNWEATASGRIHMTAYTATTNAVGKTINPVVD